MKTNFLSLDNDLDVDIVEWINGERVPIEEYERRLNNQIQYNASLYLLTANPDLNWIFGFDHF